MIPLRSTDTAPPGAVPVHAFRGSPPADPQPAVAALPGARVLLPCAPLPPGGVTAEDLAASAPPAAQRFTAELVPASPRRATAGIPGGTAPRPSAPRSTAWALGVGLGLASPAFAQEPSPAPAPPAAPPAADAPTPARQGALADDLSFGGRVLWDGLARVDVVLTLRDGTRIAGMVLAQSDGEVVLARLGSGELVRLPKALVESARVVAPAPVAAAEPEAPRGVPSGMPLIIPGAVLTGAGGTMLTVVAIAAAASSSAAYYMAPLLLFGPILAGNGIPMLIAGGALEQRRRATLEPEAAALLRAPRPQVALLPALGARRWGGQLRVRF